MPSPFPGMDPYLEKPSLWSGVHSRLIGALDEELSARLPAAYFVAVEERVYEVSSFDEELAGQPDVSIGMRERGAEYAAASGRGGGVIVLEAEVPMPDTIRETYLEIRDSEGGDAVTVIEVLSPTSKRSPVGRKQYEVKRLRILTSPTHLVEIDLLRVGTPLPARVRGDAPQPEGDYRILVARADRRPRADLYVFGVRDSIPSMPIPLRHPDTDVTVDLKPLLDGVYDRGRYRQRLDYGREPVPALSAEDAVWAAELLRTHGLR